MNSSDQVFIERAMNQTLCMRRAMFKLKMAVLERTRDKVLQIAPNTNIQDLQTRINSYANLINQELS